MQRFVLAVAVAIVSAAFLTLGLNTVAAREFELIQNDDIVAVQIDGKLFTKYHAKSGNRPILWPLIGPTGAEMTRAFPMRANGEATTDHLHHRSFWFGHGNVNGINFWHETAPFGTIKHLEFLQVESDERPRIVTRNAWIGPGEERICSDLRWIEFGADRDKRWIDFDITIVADGEEPVTFGDTKEGTFAIRVADSMRVEATPPGKIINNVEAVNKDAWGKTAAWVDYQGNVAPDDDLVGIAILNHPASFRFPTYWHVRDYGLFAANVFGWHNFKNSHEEDGSHVLAPGESISFFYRVVLHKDDERKARIPEAFVDYAKLDKQSVSDRLEPLQEDVVGSDPAKAGLTDPDVTVPTSELPTVTDLPDDELEEAVVPITESEPEEELPKKPAPPSDAKLQNQVPL